MMVRISVRTISLTIIINVANYADGQASSNFLDIVVKSSTLVNSGHSSRFPEPKINSIADGYELLKSEDNVGDLEMTSQPYEYGERIKLIKKLLQCKTKYILMERSRGTDKPFFFATISTFFNGNLRKKYFEGTEIMSNPVYRNYPASIVLYFDFSRLDYTDTFSLERGLRAVLREQIDPKMENKNLNSFTWLGLLHLLMNETLGNDPEEASLIVLVDDYPIERLQNYRNLRRAKQNAFILESFYEALQKYSAFIKFVLVIGTAKFNAEKKNRSSYGALFANPTSYGNSRVANSDDISFSHEELKNNLYQNLKSNFNLSSVLECFRASEVACYYQDYDFSGYIENYLRKHPDLTVEDIEKKEIPGILLDRKSYEPIELSKFDVHFTLYLLLVGYLTFSTYDHKSNMYSLRFRNDEARENFKFIQYRTLSGRKNLNFETLQSFCFHLKQDLQNGSFSEIVDDLNYIGFEIEQNLNVNSAGNVLEHAYNKAVYDLFQYCDIPVLAMKILFSKEGRTLGDIDLMTTTFNPNYLIELKKGQCSVCLAFDKLLTYLKNDDIREKLQIDNNELILVGAHISNHDRTRGEIDKWLKVSFKNGEYFDPQASHIGDKCFHTFRHLKKIFQ